MEHLGIFSLLLLISTVISSPQHETAAAEARGLTCTEAIQTINVGEIATFNSPRYPSNYFWFDRCTRTFQAPADAFLSVNCDPIDLGFLAFLSVTDGDIQGSITSTSMTFVSMSNRITLSFQNNFIFTASGFSCRITAMEHLLGDCKCGQSQGNRIVGGQDAGEDEYPWMAALVVQGTKTPFCGGTLISDAYVLTAAHCTESRTADAVEVRLGVLDVENDEGQRKQVLQIIDHPNYNSANNDLDFSLLRIEPIDFTDADFSAIRPACLPVNNNNLYQNENTIVTGWGATMYQGFAATILQEVEVPVVNNPACVTTYQTVSLLVNDNMICAGEGGKDSCQGDSGGPLLFKDTDNIFELIGVVSFGRFCADTNFPGVYARVTRVADWISDNTIAQGFCPRPS